RRAPAPVASEPGNPHVAAQSPPRPPARVDVCVRADRDRRYTPPQSKPPQAPATQATPAPRPSGTDRYPRQARPQSPGTRRRVAASLTPLSVAKARLWLALTFDRK